MKPLHPLITAVLVAAFPFPSAALATVQSADSLVRVAWFIQDQRRDANGKLNEMFRHRSPVVRSAAFRAAAHLKDSLYLPHCGLDCGPGVGGPDHGGFRSRTDWSCIIRTGAPGGSLGRKGPEGADGHVGCFWESGEGRGPRRTHGARVAIDETSSSFRPQIADALCTEGLKSPGRSGMHSNHSPTKTRMFAGGRSICSGVPLRMRCCQLNSRRIKDGSEA